MVEGTKPRQFVFPKDHLKVLCHGFVIVGMSEGVHAEFKRGLVDPNES